MTRGRKKKAEAALVLALACGATPESAAEKAGVSLRTVQRRLADPAFVAQVRQARAEMVRRTAGLFTAAGISALKTFTNLQESANSEAVRLGAARAIIELGCKLRESQDLDERLTTLESTLENLLSGNEAEGNVPERPVNHSNPRANPDSTGDDSC